MRSPSLARRAGSLRPYGLHALVLAYTPVLLVVDGWLASPRVQAALGALTLALLYRCTRGLDPATRRQVWLCVPVATVFEAFGSLIWGGYHYQLGNIPLYVPPGHGLVYWFGVSAASLPAVRRHARGLRHVAVGVSAVWAVAGLTLLPLLGHRLDVAGAVIWPLLAWCVLRSRRATMFAGIWLATAVLELAGTWAGAWTWAAVTPWSHLPSGNPPSAIAAGYAVIDGSVLALALLLAVVGRWFQTSGRARRERPAASPSSLQETA